MFHNYGYEVSIILKNAERERFSLKHPYVGTEHLLLAILKEDNEVSRMLLSYNFSYDTFCEELLSVVGSATKAQDVNLYTPMLKRVIELANFEATENNKGVVTPVHLFLALLEEAEGVAFRILISFDLPLDDIYNQFRKVSFPKEKNKNLEIFKIGVSLCDSVNKCEKIVGREDEITLMIETLLRRGKNNPLLIGKAGVGKTALVEELARRIKCKEVPALLEGYDIILLEMGALVSGTKYRGEFEERLHKIIKEVKNAGNIILFIDEIHTMVHAGGAEGAIAAADILKPYLARGDLKVIGATTLAEYHEYFEKDKALDRRFEHIMIEEPTRDSMKDILYSLKPSVESHYGVTLTDENINDFLDCSEEYLFSKCNPDRTIELMDSVCARIKLKHESLIKRRNPMELKKIQKRKEKCVKLGDYETAIYEATLEDELRKEIESKNKKECFSISKHDILEMIECKTHARICVDYRKVIDEIRENLFQNILGQDKALNDILDVMECPRKSGTSFLLFGGSGVGKTETVKIISDTLKTNLIRIDMSEYSSLESINKLLGAPSGYVGYDDSYVFESLRENPFSTILFDEIEKAHPQVLNLLLQILDEGYIMDRKGNKIRFDHTFIFMTSNVMGKSSVGFDQTLSISFDDILSRELVGRIDKIISYESISLDVAREYVQKNLKNPDISIENILAEADVYKYGLRNVRNLVHKYNKRLDYQKS